MSAHKWTEPHWTVRYNCRIQLQSTTVTPQQHPTAVQNHCLAYSASESFRFGSEDHVRRGRAGRASTPWRSMSQDTHTPPYRRCSMVVLHVVVCFIDDFRVCGGVCCVCCMAWLLRGSCHKAREIVAPAGRAGVCRSVCCTVLQVVLLATHRNPKPHTGTAGCTRVPSQRTVGGASTSILRTGLPCSVRRGE